MTEKNEFGYQGYRTPQDAGSEYNAIRFILRQALATLRTATLVRIVSCTNDGGLSPVGFVDVQPLVNQLDGFGNAVPHVTVYRLPYLRIQGGANAVIIDPQPGDIGVAVFADRDISSVKATRAQANPGSARMFDMADGMYLGGMLNGAPTQWVRFSDAGIEISSPTKVTLSAPVIELDGQLVQGQGEHGGDAVLRGPVTVIEDLTAAGISVSTHTHGGVEPGSSNTAEPNPS